MKKQLVLMMAAALLGLTLFACGGGDSPEVVVEKAMSAMVAMDGDALGDYLCAKSLVEAKQALEMAKAMMPADQKFEMKLSDMKYEVTEEAEDKATVHVTGQVTVTGLGDEEQSEPVDEQMQVIKEDGKWKVCEGFL